MSIDRANHCSRVDQYRSSGRPTEQSWQQHARRAKNRQGERCAEYLRIATDAGSRWHQLTSSDRIPFERNRSTRACFAAAARFLSSSAVRKPMRYWASSRARAVGSIPNVERISSPNLLSNRSTVLGAGMTLPDLAAFTRTTPPTTWPLFIRTQLAGSAKVPPIVLTSSTRTC